MSGGNGAKPNGDGPDEQVPERIAGHTLEQYLRAVEDTGAILKNAAKKLGVARSTVYVAKDTWPELAAAIVEEREKVADMVEQRILEQCQQGNMTALIWYSKTQMKNRGYVERQEVTGKDGGPIKHEVDVDELRTRLRNRIAGVASRLGT